MFMEEPANPAPETETSTEEDTFGKPVLLGKGTYNMLYNTYNDVYKYFNYNNSIVVPW